ncbi:hypothetical protein [Planktotalea sp.]|uniref:hypothetical protein n=1 Tax=Planktotalea sp. TaxID=2029877 RepID=UPI003D6B088E
MKPPIKPFHLGKILIAALLTALAFALLSLFLLFVQARNAQHHLAGEVISVEGTSITIQNARGKKTVLVVPSQATLHGVDAISGLVLGQHIMSKGMFIDEVFEVDRLRVVRDFERK